MSDRLRKGVDYTVRPEHGTATTLAPMPWPAVCPECGTQWEGIELMPGASVEPFQEGNEFGCLRCDTPFIVEIDGFRKLTDAEIRTRLENPSGGTR